MKILEKVKEIFKNINIFKEEQELSDSVTVPEIAGLIVESNSQSSDFKMSKEDIEKTLNEGLEVPVIRGRSKHRIQVIDDPNYVANQQEKEAENSDKQEHNKDERER